MTRIRCCTLCTGFMNAKKWLKNIYKYLKRSDCIAVTQFIQNHKKQINKSYVITTVNVYASKIQHLKNYKTELHMYSGLGTLLLEVKNIQLIL